MRDRAEVLKNFLRLLNRIEDRLVTEEAIEIKLTDGTVLKLIVLVDKKVRLKLVKPS